MAKVTNLQNLKELIFNGYVDTIPLGFTYTGSDCYPCLQDKMTKQVYVKHTDESYYQYDNVEQAISEYKELGCQISYNNL